MCDLTTSGTLTAEIKILRWVINFYFYFYVYAHYQIRIKTRHVEVPCTNNASVHFRQALDDTDAFEYKIVVMQNARCHADKLVRTNKLML